MRLLCEAQSQSMSPSNAEEFEVYQNSTVSQSGTVIASGDDDTISNATITQQPVYNNY